TFQLFGFADEVIHAYATERVLALGTLKLWITLWFMLLVYYKFNIQGTLCECPRLMTNLNNVVGAKYFSPQNNPDKSGRKMFRPYSHFILKTLNKKNFVSNLGHAQRVPTFTYALCARVFYNSIFAFNITSRP
ncbi:hypothetical protein, partial [Actinobacillus porcinus]|uniref:hypothetical protein n=1 Tax=Actinobacillus porcinus TaxID=51048 RepID=UPI002A90D9DD